MAADHSGDHHPALSDSHGNAQNLLIERFPADVTVIRAFPRPLGMMEGIDSTFDAAIFIGYHASTASPVGVRAHTLSSANYAGVALNGVPVPEGGINAAIAGHFGVPVVMVSGDDAAVEEMRRLIGNVEGAVVKRALGFHSAALPHLRGRLRAGTGAVARSRNRSNRGSHLFTVPQRCPIFTFR